MRRTTMIGWAVALLIGAGCASDAGGRGLPGPAEPTTSERATTTTTTTTAPPTTTTTTTTTEPQVNPGSTTTTLVPTHRRAGTGGVPDALFVAFTRTEQAALASWTTADLLAVPWAACDRMDAGELLMDFAIDYIVGYPAVLVGPVGWLVGAGVENYCPQHSWQVDTIAGAYG